MISQQDFLYAQKIVNITANIKIYYTLPILLFGSISHCYALAALFFSKETGISFQRREKKLVISIFRYKYIIGLIFMINMVFIDSLLSYSLFGYTLTKNVPDLICKLQITLKRYIYCVAPWYQMMVTFDRYWAIVLNGELTICKWKIKRNEDTVKRLIKVVLFIVILITLFNLTCYDATSVSILSQFDPVQNVSIPVNITQSECIPINKNIQTAQNVLFLFMFIIIPLFLMIRFNNKLVKHVRESRSRVIGRRGQQREINLTRGVVSNNFLFFVFNSPIIIFYMIYSCLRYSEVDASFSIVDAYLLNLFYVVGYLLSFTFTMIQFLIDIKFNRLFREEMIAYLEIKSNSSDRDQQINRTTDQQIAETIF